MKLALEEIWGVKLFQAMNAKQFLFCFLLAVIVWTNGCSIFGHRPDPLSGWNALVGGRELDEFEEASGNDYKDYVQKLSPEERDEIITQPFFFKDGTGQHAIKIEIPLNGTWWVHVLFYDKDNKRIKVIKLKNGSYRC